MAANLIGGNLGLGGAAPAGCGCWRAGRLAEYSDVNLAALERAGPLLTPEARAKVALLRRGRAAAAPAAGSPAAARLGLYRQTRGGTADALARLRRRPALAGRRPPAAAPTVRRLRRVAEASYWEC